MSAARRLAAGLRIVARERPGTVGPVAPALRLAVVATVAESGYVHAKLYVDGYHFIPHIGAMFLLQAAVSFALAALLVFPAPLIVQLGAAGTALGALGGFVLSRTVGIWGFTERGLQPHPDALLSVLSESATLGLLGVLWIYLRRRRAGVTAPIAVGTQTS